MRVALIYDHLNKLGGAEVILQQLHQLYPQADWYTSVWNSDKIPFTRNWHVKTSWLNRVPWLKNHHELVPFLMPFIFESFDLSSYDLVISIGAMAKGVITRADTLHLNYCLTPTRYLWSHQQLYLFKLQFGWLQRLATPLIKLIFRYLSKWDLLASTRPDIMISISEHVKKRVKKYYNRKTQLLYPPINLKRLTPSLHHLHIADLPKNYYLSVARLVPYKNIDFLINLFATLDSHLVIVGTGTELNRLRHLASRNVHLVGQVSDSKLSIYYQNCQAFIQANIEDFGIAMVEALSFGKPVIAYNQGGAKEIVIDKKTGILVSRLELSAFKQAINKLAQLKIQPQACRQQAQKFSSVKWQKQLKSYISKAYDKNNSTT